MQTSCQNGVIKSEINAPDFASPFHAIACIPYLLSHFLPYKQALLEWKIRFKLYFVMCLHVRHTYRMLLEFCRVMSQLKLLESLKSYFNFLLFTFYSNYIP